MEVKSFSVGQAPYSVQGVLTMCGSDISLNIGGGMLPKLNNCIEAIETGVSRVHIMDGRIPHCLLLEIFTNKGIGTAIIDRNAERFYDEDKDK